MRLGPVASFTNTDSQKEACLLQEELRATLHCRRERRLSHSAAGACCPKEAVT